MTARSAIISFVAVAALVVTAAIPAASTFSGAAGPFSTASALRRSQRPVAAAASVAQATCRRSAPAACALSSSRMNRVGQGGDRGGRRARRAKLATPRPGRRSSRGGSGTAPIGRRRACTHAHAPDAVNGEEVTASLAPAWHAKNLTGKGVKVAVIDGGFVGLADRQAAGDLPANVVTHDFCGGRFNTETEHGTAVAEIVHEMAPERSCTSSVSTRRSISLRPRPSRRPRACSVISHSASWFGPDRGDGSGHDRQRSCRIRPCGRDPLGQLRRQLRRDALVRDLRQRGRRPSARVRPWR